MSIASWKAEFYPVPVQELKEIEKLSNEELIQHSLKKWRGATKDNLAKHGLMKIPGKGFIAYYFGHKLQYFSFGANSCSLCKVYSMQDKRNYDEEECINCPLSQLGDCCLYEGSSYFKFIISNDPKPMIKLLERALKKEEQTNK